MDHNILQSHIWSNPQHYLQTIYDTAVNKAVSMHSTATGTNAWLDTTPAQWYNPPAVCPLALRARVVAKGKVF